MEHEFGGFQEFRLSSNKDVLQAGTRTCKHCGLEIFCHWIDDHVIPNLLADETLSRLLNCDTVWISQVMDS